MFVTFIDKKGIEKLKMMISDNIESFIESLDELSGNYNVLYNHIRKLKDLNADETILQRSNNFIKNTRKRHEQIKAIHDNFSSQFLVLSTQLNNLCDQYMIGVNKVEEEDKHEVEVLKDEFEKMKEEISERNDELKNDVLKNGREPSFVYQNNIKSMIDIDLAMKYSGSYLYREYMSDNRNKDGDMFIDNDGENDELIVKYMKNDKSLIDDVKKMNVEKKKKLLNDLVFMELPIKKIIIDELGQNEDSEMMNAWKNRRVVMVNGKNASNFNILLMKYGLFDCLFNNEMLKNIQYYKDNNTFFINMNLKYFEVIEDYLKNEKTINEKLVKKCCNNTNELVTEMKMIGIQLKEDEIQQLKDCLSLLYDSKIIVDTQYDNYLKEWLGVYKWKLIYRSSKNGFTAKSFHKYCNYYSPTLVVIKSRDGWIFGGYTTQLWNGCSIYYEITY